MSENWISAREAAERLGIVRSRLFVMATRGLLRSQLIEEPGQKVQRLFLESDVDAQAGKRKRRHRKSSFQRVRVVWRRFFGAIPTGLRVIPLDGNKENVSPKNLALVPNSHRIERALERKKPAARAERRGRMDWTAEKIEQLKALFDSKTNAELADVFGCSASIIARKAKQLQLRRSREALGQRKSKLNLPVGSEHPHGSGFTMLKVGPEEATPSGKVWRYKHHVLWERAHGRKIPPGMRLSFKDGNRENFAIDNLELTTLRVISAKAFANYLALPEPIQKVKRMTRKLERAVDQKIMGEKEAGQSGQRRRARAGYKQSRWTDEQIEIIERDYPTKSTEDIAALVGRSVNEVRIKARRLGVRRSPQAMIALAQAKSEQALQQVLK